MGEDSRGGVSRPEVEFEETGESKWGAWLDFDDYRQYLVTVRVNLAHLVSTELSWLSVRRRFFKLGSVCRISSARRSRSAIN